MQMIHKNLILRFIQDKYVQQNMSISLISFGSSFIIEKMEQLIFNNIQYNILKSHTADHKMMNNLFDQSSLI